MEHSDLKPFRVVWSLPITLLYGIVLWKSFGTNLLAFCIVVVLLAPLWLFILWYTVELFSIFSAFLVFPLLQRINKVWQAYLIALLGDILLACLLLILGKCGCAMSDDTSDRLDEYIQRIEPR